MLGFATLLLIYDWRAPCKVDGEYRSNPPVLSLGATLFFIDILIFVYIFFRVFEVSRTFLFVTWDFQTFSFIKNLKILLWGFIPSVFCVIESQFSPHLRSILNSNNSSLFLMTKYANLVRVDSREIILKFQLQNVKWKFNQYQQQHSVGVSALSERDKE